MPTGDVQGLKVFVVGRTVEGGDGGGREDEFPRYGPYRIYRAATRGKVGGLPDGVTGSDGAPVLSSYVADGMGVVGDGWG